MDLPLNRPSYHTRLALARAFSRTEDGVTEAQKYYNEVLVMAPEVRDRGFGDTI